MSQAQVKIKYQSEATCSKFHRSNAFVRGVMGPVRSGKSTGMSNEIFRRATEQKHGPDGIRRSRWLVVRNTYRELEDTTIRTWLDWFPEEYFGALNRGAMSHRVRFDDVVFDVDFRALDKPGDIKKLLSAEYTGAWVNEAREIPKGVIDVITDRVGQYPAAKDGGCTWSGVIMDTNPPDSDHWWYKLAEETKPRGWKFFRQPGALVEVKGKWRFNPAAENIGNLNEGKAYYLKRVHGKAKDYITVYYCGEYGFVMEGKPVHPLFKQHIHVSDESLPPVRGAGVGFGCDFGLTPAAVFGQTMASGQVRILSEITTENMGAENFGKLLSKALRSKYKGGKAEGWGDPAGDQRSQIRESETVFKVLHGQNIPITTAGTNDPVLRQEALNHLLSRLDMNGEPAILIDPSCRMLIKGLAGGYKYRRLQIGGSERYADSPDKNLYSHVCEALHYYLLGIGMGGEVIDGRAGRNRTKPRVKTGLRGRHTR